MNNKVFAFLVIVLSLMIVASCIWLISSINKYNNITNGTIKENVTETKEENTKEQVTNEPIMPSPDESDRVPEPTSSNTSQYILPSDTKEIYESDLVNMDYDTLNKAYNEIFARHGHDFATATLKDYFKNQSWYKPVDGKKVDVSELSELETKNLNVIKARIDKIKN